MEATEKPDDARRSDEARAGDELRIGNQRGAGNQLVALVDLFVRELEQRGSVDVELFVARAPARLRAELHARCVDITFLRRVMPSSQRRD